MRAIATMLGKHGIACDLMHGINWDKWTGQMTNGDSQRAPLIWKPAIGARMLA
jgi:hypothetical protein